MTDDLSGRPTPTGSVGPADLVLVGGRVVRMDRERTVANAVAVRDGRIVAVGEDGAVRAWIGPRSRVVELRGRTVTPGFGDAHVHPISSGLDRMRCDLDEQRGLDDYLAAIATYAMTHPDEPWIRGGGWSMADFPGGIPHRADLDRVVPDRPVFLDQPRRAHGMGQLPGARARRASLPTPLIPWTAGSSVTRTARRQAPSRRAPPTWSSVCFRPTRRPS